MRKRDVMKASFLKTVFLFFWYLTVAYLLSYCAIEFSDWAQGLKVVDTWDKINRVCLMIITLILCFMPLLFLFIAFAVVNGYLKKLKEERFFK